MTTIATLMLLVLVVSLVLAWFSSHKCKDCGKELESHESVHTQDNKVICWDCLQLRIDKRYRLR